MIRFGCHNFINVQPLIYPLTHGLVDHDFKMIFDSPANISDMLKAGNLDLAFIPSIEYLNSTYSLIDGHSISSMGRVASVLLISKKELAKVKHIAIDSRSKTSVAMLKILLHQRHRQQPELISMDPLLERMLAKCDAALLIGDPALLVEREGLYIYDLGEEWYSYTKEAFVHAVLVSPSKQLDNSICRILNNAKKRGQENIADIARFSSVLSSIPYELCLDYLTNIIRYDLGKDEIKGLKRFYELAVSCGQIVSERKIWTER